MVNGYIYFTAIIFEFTYMKCAEQANPETKNSLLVAKDCKRRNGELLLMDLGFLSWGDECSRIRWW